MAESGRCQAGKEPRRIGTQGERHTGRGPPDGFGRGGISSVRGGLGYLRTLMEHIGYL